ncbi:cysteine-rich receptor-like protein kinase 25 [Durio zibethinus]|uniref:Cysteine-rich receptor-like protein kinase 25 n=1 Tax=Durio zibethinus TaxID=66656 RepID=A0A6P6BJV5_DURZI|nr:cysteine-rich receptor-like protein kinase 25 [Durio zibethinus]
MLRYSDGSIFGKMAFEPYCALRDDNIATNVSQFDQVLSTLLDDLITQTASGDSLLKFATGNATVSNSEIIYALAQCTPDLSLVDCKDCLSNATDVLSKFCSGRLGARVFTPSSNVRYDKGIFFDRLPVLPLPPVAADAPVSPPVDAPSLSPSPSTSPSPSPSPPVALAPPQQPYIEIGEGNMNSGFQVLVTVVPLMILQYFVF